MNNEYEIISFEELYYWSLCNLNLIVQGMSLVS